MQAISLQSIGCQRADVFNGFGRCAQNEQAAEKWCQEGAQRIERLRQVEATRSRLGLTQHCDIGIRRYLKERNACCKNDERTQEQWIGGHAGSRYKEKGTHTHSEKPQHHRPLVANPVNDLRRRNGEDEIRPKKCELNQHHLLVIQVEDRFQVRHKNVVETGKKAPHEEERSYYH